MLETIIHGAVVAAAGMAVVFGALTLLVFVVLVTRRLSRLGDGAQARPPAQLPAPAAAQTAGRLPGAVVAAIAVALTRPRRGALPVRITEVRRRSPHAWQSLPAERHWHPRSEATP